MSDDATAKRADTFLGARAAVSLAGGFLAALALTVVLGISARRNVAALEQFEELSAVGDTAFFQRPPEVPKPPVAVAHLAGAPLFLLAVEKIEIRDTKMVRAGRDEAAGLTIYQPRKPIDGEKHDPRDHYLKIDRDDYVKVRAGK